MPHGSCCGMGHAGQPRTGVAAGLKAVLAGFFIIDSGCGHVSGDALSLLIQGTQNWAFRSFAAAAFSQHSLAFG